MYKKMPLSPKKLLLTLLAIFIFGIIFRFLSILYFPDSEIVLQKGELLKLLPEDSITQTFAANRSNLAKIDFLMRTPGPKSTDTIAMQLADESCKNIIRQGTLELAFLNSDNLYDFRFDPIPDSNGQKYCVIANFENGDSKYIRFFMMENKNPDFVLTDTDGTQQQNQSLSMRLAYKNDNFSQSIGELNQRISQYKPWFLKHYYLGTLATLFIVLAISLAVILIII